MYDEIIFKEETIIIGVYKIINKLNGKMYIGSSKDIQRRWKEHIGDLNNNKHINPHFQNSWSKYGEYNFKFEVIEETKEDSLLDREQYWMDFTQCFVRTIGYNIAVKADSPMRGRKLTSKQIDELSKRSIKMWESDEFRKSHSDKMKLVFTDPIKKEQYLIPLRKWAKLDSSKLIMSNRFKQLWKDEEYRNKITESVKNMWSDEQFKDMMSKKRTGEKNPRAIFTNLQIEDIKVKLVEGCSTTELGKMYGTTSAHIRNIRCLKIWSKIREDLNEELLKLIHKK